VALLPRFERAQDGAAQVCPIRRDGQRRAAIETLHARRRVGAQARGTSNQLRGRKRTRLRSRRKSINVRRRFVIVGRARHLGGIIRSGVRLCNASCIIAAALKSIEADRSMSRRQSARAARYALLMSCALILGACAAARGPEATRPRANEPTYPIILSASTERRELATAAW